MKLHFVPRRKMNENTGIAEEQGIIDVVDVESGGKFGQIIPKGDDWLWVNIPNFDLKLDLIKGEKLVNRILNTINDFQTRYEKENKQDEEVP